jgi:hypothetical protein
MTTSFESRKPRFTIGEKVRVIGPGLHRDKHGLITEVVNPSAGDFVYRYRVRFANSLSATFFGFELHPLKP